MHPKSYLQRAAQGVMGLSLICAAWLPALAHGPFDNSVYATLRTDTLEISVVLGADAAHQILKHASPEHPVSLGGMVRKSLPVELTAQFMELKSGGTTLQATQFNVLGDGLEYRFTATYPHPVISTVSFRGLYFDIGEYMRPGVLTLADENGVQLASGLLSRGSTVMEITLPLTANPSAFTAATSTTQVPATTATVPANSPITTHPAPSATPTVISILAIITAAGLCWFVLRLILKRKIAEMDHSQIV